MYGLVLIEMAHIAEQEHMREAIMARARAQARRARRTTLGPGRVARAWAAFWAPREVVRTPRAAAGQGSSFAGDLTPCTDC